MKKIITLVLSILPVVSFGWVRTTTSTEVTMMLALEYHFDNTHVMLDF